MRSGGSEAKVNLIEALANKGIILGKRIGAGEFGEVYIATYVGKDDPNIEALLNKDGELVVKLAKTPIYQFNPKLTNEQRNKAEQAFQVKVEAAAKTVENEFKMITEGLGQMSLLPDADFIPKVHAEEIGGNKIIYNELINGMNLETYLRQMGKDELIRALSLAPVIDQNVDSSSGYAVVDSDDENLGYAVEEDSLDAEEGVGYVADPGTDEELDVDTIGGSDDVDLENRDPSNDSPFAGVREHETTKNLIAILNALGPLIEKFNLLGFAHNDFSCRNVMVMFESDGRLKGLKLVDFGLTLKLGADGNCIENPNIGVCPRTLYGRLEKRWDRSVVTEGMCLQYAKIEALAIFMGYLALPEAGSGNNPDIKNVFADIHQKWLTCKNGTITNQHDNAERLENSVRNLDVAATSLELENGDVPTRDPRGIIVEYIVSELRSELVKVPARESAKFNAYSPPVNEVAVSTVLNDASASPLLSVNALMHKAIGASKETTIDASVANGVDENTKGRENVNQPQAPGLKGKDEALPSLGPCHRKR